MMYMSNIVTIQCLLITLPCEEKLSPMTTTQQYSPEKIDVSFSDEMRFLSVQIYLEVHFHISTTISSMGKIFAFLYNNGHFSNFLYTVIEHGFCFSEKHCLFHFGKNKH